MNRKQRRIAEAKGPKKPVQMTPEHQKILLSAIELQQAGNLDIAEQVYRTLLVTYPRSPTLLHTLGTLNVTRGNVEEGIRLLETAISLKPNFAEAYCERASAFMKLGRYDESMASLNKAIAANPDYALGHCGKGILQLLLGQMEEGWKEFEWRWKSLSKSEFREYTQPLWLGKEPLAGKTILLYPEQGLGDAIQLCRYTPMVEALGAKVILGVPSTLAALVSTLKGSYRIMTEKESFPPFDLRCPHFSLPLAFSTTLRNIPADVPYLYANPDKRKVWQERLGQKVRPRIGLVWSGTSKHKNDFNRSIALERLAPLLKNDNVDFHSLQKEYKPQDMPFLAQGRVATHAELLIDFDDTAALAAEMDLILSVDTSLAHLAGAMGKPVWILLPFVPDFRWLLEREDSPWYPTARLLRQPRAGDWDSVIARVVNELASARL